MINAGNPSAHNLKIRKYVAENKQSSAQIFEKLNRRGRLNSAQNAMSAQLTNEQLLRFYIKDTEPELEIGTHYIYIIDMDKNVFLVKFYGTRREHYFVFDIHNIPASWDKLIEDYYE